MSLHEAHGGNGTSRPTPSRRVEAIVGSLSAGSRFDGNESIASHVTNATNMTNGSTTTYVTAQSTEFADRPERNSAPTQPPISETSPITNGDSAHYRDDPLSLNNDNGFISNFESAIHDLRNRLKIGDVVQRYCIQSKLQHEEPHTVYAIDIETKKRVVLRFCRDTRELIRLTKGRPKELKGMHGVCKLLDRKIANNELPPYLVFECGEYTLHDVLRNGRCPEPRTQRLILRDVLSVLECLHTSNLAHGDLRPEMIGWFEKEAVWKLLDYDGNIQSIFNVPRTTTLSYVAPERVVLQNPTVLPTLTAAGDMWSFGVVAYEVITGRRYYGDRASREDIEDVFNTARPLPDIGCLHNYDAETLLGLYLQIDPTGRFPASYGVNSNFINDVTFDVQSCLDEIRRDLRTLVSVTAVNVRNIEASNLQISVAIESFVSGNEDAHSLSATTTKPVPTFSETMRRDTTVFVCRSDQTCFLRIVLENSLGHENLPFDEVEGLNVRIGDENVVLRRFEILESSPRRHELIALLTKDAFKSNALREATPCFGEFSKRTIELNVTVSLKIQCDGLDNPSLNPVPLSQRIYINVVGNRFILLYHQGVQALKNFWACLPQPARAAAKVALFLWSVGSNFATP